MPDRTLVATVTIGQKCEAMAEITHPSIRAYADKIGAEFLVIKNGTGYPHPSWEKFQAYDLLTEYDRILLIDTDVIVRQDCPDLFKLVPEDYLGMFNGGPYHDLSTLMMHACLVYREFFDEWKGDYYNGGVIVASKIHRSLFERPAETHDSYIEQGYLNIRIQRDKIKMFDIGLQCNRLYSFGGDRLGAYVIHYAGTVDGKTTVNQAIKDDLSAWEKSGF